MIGGRRNVRSPERSRRRSRATALILALGLLSFPSLLQAQDATIEFDHFGENRNLAYSVEMADGETLLIRVLNTCGPEHFEYVHVGIERSEDSLKTQSREAKPCTADQDFTTTITHQERFGGYLFFLHPRGNLILCPSDRGGRDCLPARTLVLTIAVEERTWSYEVSGAFTISRLTDPRFALQIADDSPSGGTEGEQDTPERIVIRDRDAEDDETLGFAGMIHVHHTDAPWVAGSFGMGIGDDSDVSFFLGPSLRFGGKGFLTAGWNWGPVDRLPTGVRVNDRVSDANLLLDLPTRTRGRFFFALSYGFVSPGEERIKKPFAGGGDPTE